MIDYANLKKINHILDEMEKIREILKPFVVEFPEDKRKDLEFTLVQLELLLRG